MNSRNRPVLRASVSVSILPNPVRCRLHHILLTIEYESRSGRTKKLTFNTTSLSLERAIRRGNTLLVREPLRPFGDQVRWLVVTPEIDELLDGKRLFGVFPDVESERLIAHYSAGWLVTVSRKKTKRKPDLERIEGYDEIWALCPRRPRPGWRLLGRFIAKDTLVLLRAWEKNRLFANYPQAAQEVIDDWKRILGSEEPHRGNEVGDYLSSRFRDVDQI